MRKYVTSSLPTPLLTSTEALNCTFHHVFHVLYLAAGCEAFVTLADVEEGWRGATGGSMCAISAPRSINEAISRRITHGDVHNPATSFSDGAAPVAHTHVVTCIWDVCVCGI